MGIFGRLFINLTSNFTRTSRKGSGFLVICYYRGVLCVLLGGWSGK